MVRDKGKVFEFYSKGRSQTLSSSPLMMEKKREKEEERKSGLKFFEEYLRMKEIAKASQTKPYWPSESF